MKVRDIYWRRYKIQETLYIGQWHLSPLHGRYLGTSHSSPSAAPSYIPESHQQSEVSSLSKLILVLGKARSCRVPNLCCSGAESPGWFDVLPKNSIQDVMHERAHCCDEAANHQLAAFWIIWIVSVEEYLSLMESLMQIHCSTCLAILNATSPCTHAHSTVSTIPTD